MLPSRHVCGSHGCVCFSYPYRQQDLFRVLKAYTLYRPEEGYCQAQAPIAAVLLMHMPAEVSGWMAVRTPPRRSILGVSLCDLCKLTAHMDSQGDLG